HTWLASDHNPALPPLQNPSERLRRQTQKFRVFGGSLRGLRIGQMPYPLRIPIGFICVVFSEHLKIDERKNRNVFFPRLLVLLLRHRPNSTKEFRGVLLE